MMALVIGLVIVMDVQTIDSVLHVPQGSNRANSERPARVDVPVTVNKELNGKLTCCF
jgi:hypothetical protein